MIRAFGLTMGAVLLGSGCMPPPSAPRAKAFSAPPPLRQAALPQREFRGYRLASSYVEKSSFRDGAPLRSGALVGGLRVRTDASGLSLADSVAQPALLGGTQLPDQLGGGLLFWNSEALYTTDTFLGLLRPLLDIGYRPAAASFGPTFLLLHGNSGQRTAIDMRARQRVALSPPLLVDIASTADGRAIALLESGKCSLSTDSGKTYQPLALPASEHAVSVSSAREALLVQLSSGSVLRLEKGNPPVVAAPAAGPPSRPRADALWPLSEPPLERALRFGVPIGEEFAGVAVAGAVATVNLRTGELVQMTRALVPSDLECRTLDANGSLLLACSSRARGSIVLSDIFGERPITQAKFPPGVRLEFADGVLLAAARCDGEPRPNAVCVRGADSRFHDYDVSAKLAALAQGATVTLPKAKGSSAEISVSHFIPKEGWGALAVVTGPVQGLLDVQSGAFVALSPEAPLALLDVPQGKDSWLGLDWVALPDGAVRGWVASSSVAITRDGRLEPSVYDFRTLVTAGVRALAFDKGHHAFQSSDWGHTWVETLAPPGSASGNASVSGPHCSAVGCHLGPWLRVGWEPEVPGALSRAQVAPAPVSVVRAPLPVLACKERKAAVVSEQDQAEVLSDGDQTQALGFGTSQPSLPVSDEVSRGFFAWATVNPLGGGGVSAGLRGGVVLHTPAQPVDPQRMKRGLLEYVPPPKSWSGYAESKIFSFVPAFDPSARVRSGRVTLRALLDTAEAAGAPSPSLGGNEDDALPSLPVLGRDAGQVDGLILDDGAPVWVHDSGSAEPFSLGPEADERTIVSAVASAPHTLSLLVAGSDGSVEVREVSAGKSRRLFQLPNLDPALFASNADALAIGPHGVLAILRSRSGAEPATSADPALLLDESGAPTVLAPWSRLFLADAPECKTQPNDYRVVLQTSGAWLQIVNGGVPVNAEALDAGMFAMLRVNPDRICLEALELAQELAQRQNVEFATRLAARFVGPGKGAARLGFAPGFELRQPLDCALSVPR